MPYLGKFEILCFQFAPELRPPWHYEMSLTAVLLGGNVCWNKVSNPMVVNLFIILSFLMCVCVFVLRWTCCSGSTRLHWKLYKMQRMTVSGSRLTPRYVHVCHSANMNSKQHNCMNHIIVLLDWGIE